MNLPEPLPLVSVIIPTTAQASRRHELHRCIGALRAASTLPLTIIVVVNGQRSDAGLCDWLRAQPDVQYFYLEQPSAPNAVLHGRRQVRTPYFCAVDDDDEYLPAAIDQRLAVLKAQPDADLVVTNVYRRCDGRDQLMYGHLRDVPQQPLAMLFLSNWLYNGNALYRSAAVPVSYFEDYRAYAEWTWLAYKLALDGKQVATLEQPTFRVHVTPGSLSQSRNYSDSYLTLFQDMLNAGPPADIVRLIRRKLSAAQHDHSVQALADGRRGDAWRWHLRSLRHPGGLRYLGYTRRLLARPAAPLIGERT